MFPPFTVDSLSFSSSPAADSVGLWVEATPSPERVFGAGSHLAEAVGTNAASTPVGIAYSVALLAVLTGWILIVYIYRDYILAALGVVRGSVATEKLLEKHTKLFSVCLNWAIVLGCTTVGLACSKNIVIAGICAAAGAAVWGFQWFVLTVAGRLTLYTEFTARLFYLRKIVVTAGIIILVPLFLLYPLSVSDILGWTLSVLASMSVIFLFIRTFMLFVRQRFSILLWILYLCAVEILPVATVITAAGKLHLF